MILIILPVYNEIKTIKKTAVSIYSWCKENMKEDYNIMFVDDMSTDGTYESIKKLKTTKIKIIKNNFDKGKGSALKAAYVHATYTYKLNKDDKILFMDSDGQIEPREIKTFLRMMEIYDSDVVIGNKRHDYSNVSYNLQRRIVSKTYNMIIRILFGLSYRDTQCGIKLFKKYALDKVISRTTSKRYAFDLELIVSLIQNKLRIADAPVNILVKNNVGSVNINSIIVTFVETIIIWIKKKKGLYIQ